MRHSFHGFGGTDVQPAMMTGISQDQRIHDLAIFCIMEGWLGDRSDVVLY